MAVVLVTGGTGFVGSHIAARLKEQGHQVVVMSRNPGRTSVPEGIGVCRGDVSDSASLREAMTGVDVVVNAVQFPNAPVENRRRGYTYMAVDGEGTVRQVEAAKASGVKRFIYISGAGTREGQTAPWFRGKLLAEAAVRQSGIPYTIFRPSWIYGPDDRSLNKFATFAKLLPFVPVIGNGKGKVPILFVDDLATVVAAAIERTQATGQVYEIGGPQELTMDEIIRTMLRIMGKRKPLVHYPAWFMKLATAPLLLLPAPPLSPAAVDFILMEESVDHTALQRDFRPSLTPLAQGLSYLAPRAASSR